MTIEELQIKACDLRMLINEAREDNPQITSMDGCYDLAGALVSNLTEAMQEHNEGVKEGYIAE